LDSGPFIGEASYFYSVIIDSCLLALFELLFGVFDALLLTELVLFKLLFELILFKLLFELMLLLIESGGWMRIIFLTS
jgi:hypothetical protein